MVVRRKAATTSLTVRCLGQRCSEREVRIEMPQWKSEKPWTTLWALRPRQSLGHASKGMKAAILPQIGIEFTQESVEQPVGCVYSIRSCRTLVLVQQSAETVASFQRYRLRRRPRRR